MNVCVDVGYHASGAIAACVVFPRWEGEEVATQHAIGIAEVAPYEPGAFYRRELPCLLQVLALVTGPVDAIVVDGYVWLGPDQPGLGAHLHAALGTPVIGVAKTAYSGNTVAVEVLRGISANPLYITAVGIDVTVAATHVRSMHGEHRIPTLLGLVDRLTR